ncbi:unnamed protein product, partial [Rotaria sp. Silwood2]
VKNWFENQTLPTSYTFRNLQLPHINHVLTQIIFKKQETSTHNLVIRASAKSEEIAQNHAQIAFQERSKLLNTRGNHKNIQLFDIIMTQIVNRQNNIIQRAQYDIQQKLLIASNQTQSPFIEN